MVRPWIQREPVRRFTPTVRQASLFRIPCFTKRKYLSRFAVNGDAPGPLPLVFFAVIATPDFSQVLQRPPEPKR
jgi:hypothetical protein